MRKLKILIVDDNNNFVEAFKYMLSDILNDDLETVYQAYNGEEALDIINTSQVDYVFMDINMPVMDGIKATRLATQSFRDINIIAISFHDEFTYIKQMIEAGAKNYLLKEEINKGLLLSLLK
jgi:two-component system, NarL family, response regulator DegU